LIKFDFNSLFVGMIFGYSASMGVLGFYDTFIWMVWVTTMLIIGLGLLICHILTRVFSKQSLFEKRMV